MKRFECRWVREPNPPAYVGKCVGCPEDVVAVSKLLWGESPREIFAVWFLDNRHRVLGYQAIHEGTHSASLVDPGDVLAMVLKSGASAFIAVHNHPSGDPTPSPEDVALTRCLAEAARLVRRDLLDHVVISDSQHVSMAAEGLMPKAPKQEPWSVSKG